MEDFCQKTRHKRVAIATFVKTIGRSPAKTRLAQTIGRDHANTFYKLACEAISEILADAARDRCIEEEVCPFWAIAEHDTEDYWQSFPCIIQGDGNLAARLHHVYTTLLKDHDYVLLLAADSPQITKEILLEGAAFTSHKKNFVLGEAFDGGFYVFGGRKPLTRSFWDSIPYSCSETSLILKELLQSEGETHLLTSLSDVDEGKDLEVLLRSLAENKNLSAKQVRLKTWLCQLGYEPISKVSEPARLPILDLITSSSST